MGGLIAELLSDQGYSVNIVTPFENISPWSFMSNELNDIKVRLNEKNIRVVTESSLLSANDNSVEIINRFNRNKSSLEAGTLIIVGTRKPNDDLYNQLINSAEIDNKNIFKIGDADAPGALYHAVYSGRLFAEYFGEDVLKDEMKLEYPTIM